MRPSGARSRPAPALKAAALAFAAAMLLLQACALLRAAPAPTSAFVPEPQLLSVDKRWSPYQAIWTLEREEYERVKQPQRSIYVAPVVTTTVLEQIEASRYAPRIKLKLTDEAREVAHYMQDRFRLALENYPEHPFRVVEEPEPDSVRVELALTELQPTNAAVNALAAVAGAVVPGAGLLRLAVRGSVAFEGVVRDAGGGRVLMAFKDRRTDKSAPFTLRDFQQYAHVRVSSDEWAEQYAELSAKPIGEKISGSIPFTLKPF